MWTEAVGRCWPWHKFGGQMAACGSWFFLSTMWVMRLELRDLGLLADALTHWLSSWTLKGEIY